MTATPLTHLGASEAVRLLTRRELRAVDLMQSCLERIAEREPQLRAFVHLDPDAALAAARALDAGPVRGLLHGLPFGVKDLFDTRDMPTAFGSPIYADPGQRSRSDAAAVALCRAAGAIAIGKTVTTEFATFEPGPTRNPHAAERTPGGSSPIICCRSRWAPRPLRRSCGRRPTAAWSVSSQASAGCPVRA
jgi:Asp-tRNA(Asn)/Glu-tRNA(Gln) amidotransferase A subunit family amidase